MRRHSKFLLLFTGLTAAAAIGALLGSTREPNYRDRPLSFWLEHNFDKRLGMSPFTEEDITAFRSMGPTGLRLLSRWALWQRPTWANTVEAFGGKIGFSTDWLESRLEKLKIRADEAGRAIFFLGEDAAPALHIFARAAEKSRGTNSLSNRGRMCISWLLYAHQHHAITRSNAWGGPVVMTQLFANALKDPNPIIRQEAEHASNTLFSGSTFVAGTRAKP